MCDLKKRSKDSLQEVILSPLSGSQGLNSGPQPTGGNSLYTKRVPGIKLGSSAYRSQFCLHQAGARD